LASFTDGIYLIINNEIENYLIDFTGVPFENPHLSQKSFHVLIH
jgi:hypothetical protein